MPRLTVAPGLLGGLVVLAASCWWLATLQSGRPWVDHWVDDRVDDWVDVPYLSFRAAFWLILVQWMAIGLFAARWSRGDAGASAIGLRSTVATAGFASLAAAAPAWPLLALLWLSSSLPALVLIASQVLAVLFGTAFALLGTALARSTVDAPLADALATAAGVTAAAAVWLSRSQLQLWLQP